MKLFGLTGGVGMGKSTAANFLSAAGVRVVDADDLARQIVQPGQPALAEITAHFGKNILGSNGELNRGALAKIVFADVLARNELEKILHPRIRAAWLARIETWRGENQPLAFVVIPLLFETQAENQFDKIICVACSAVEQQRRLAARGWNGLQIQQRIAAQMPVEQKIARAQVVIWTEGGVASHRRQITRFLAQNWSPEKLAHCPQLW